jgi:hypothetical protein
MSTPALELRSEHPFWRWQICGWLAYGVAMFVAAVQELSFGDALVNKSANVVIGFSSSLALRQIYLRLRAREAPMARILLVMLGSCFVAGALWSMLANSFFWLYMLRDLGGMLPRHLFSWTLVHAIALVAWCAIYLGARQFDELQRAAALAQSRTTANDDAHPPLTVRAEGQLLRLPQEQIHCIEAARNYSCIVSDAGTHVVRMPLSALAARLDPRAFIRVHRSAIVAVSRLRALRNLPTQDAIATLAGGREVRVSRGFRARVEQALTTRH